MSGKNIAHLLPFRPGAAGFANLLSLSMFHEDGSISSLDHHQEEMKS